MKSQTIQEMSQEALLKQKKTIKLVMGMLAGALSVLLVMVVLLASKKGLDGTSIGLGVIPFALLPILFLNWNQLKAIEKELNARQNGFEECWEILVLLRLGRLWSAGRTSSGQTRDSIKGGRTASRWSPWRSEGASIPVQWDLVSTDN